MEFKIYLISCRVREALPAKAGILSFFNFFGSLSFLSLGSFPERQSLEYLLYLQLFR
jgi:hypothetical protein